MLGIRDCVPLSFKQKLSQVKKRLTKHQDFVNNRTKFFEEGSDNGDANLAAAQEQFWKRVKTTLHDKGNWKKIPFELLKVMVEIAIDQEDHQLRMLWKFIKSKMISSDVKARLPTFLIQEKFSYMLHGN